MISLKPETVAIFKDMVQRKGEFIHYLAEHGNDFEKAAASVMLKAAND